MQDRRLSGATTRLRKVFRARLLDVVDVIVYILILVGFVQLFPAVITESFLLTVLTAILLKVVLECVVPVKKRLAYRLRGAPTVVTKVAFVLALIAVMAGSQTRRARTHECGFRRQRVPRWILSGHRLDRHLDACPRGCTSSGREPVHIAVDNCS